MYKCPCEDCITYTMCKNRHTYNDEFYLFTLYETCDMLYDYLFKDFWDGDKLNSQLTENIIKRKSKIKEVFKIKNIY